MNESRNQSKKADAPAEVREKFPEAFHYTTLQFNTLPGWARDTILKLEAKLASQEAARS